MSNILVQIVCVRTDKLCARVLIIIFNLSYWFVHLNLFSGDLLNATY